MRLFYKATAYLVLSLPAIAQSQTFAKITIKPTNSADPSNMRMQILSNGDLIANAVPVIMLLSYAYDVPVDPSPRLYSLPDWTIRERYDIQGKAIAKAVSPNSRIRNQQEIRELLADRFKLAMRTENKKMSVYALTVARSRPNLQKSALTDKDCTFDTGPEGCHNFVPGFGHPLNAKAIDMDDLAHYISNWTDLPVVNRTSLTGLFTVHTEGWRPMRLPPPPPDAPPDVNHFAGLPTIFRVLDELGIELNRQVETLPVYTVEHIARPDFN
jgi:uncharacterized protein (TIGR03435 family)